MVEVHGFCDERFAPIGDQFRAGLEDGSDEGASYAIDVNGELVVDLWGGFRDLARTKPWESDTLVRVLSTSKVVTAIAILMLWGRGLIDLDAPVATYWPEFAQNGKAAITTRQVLVHRAGVPGFGRSITAEDVVDWDRMVGIMEQAAVWYEPGTRTAYQHVTFGYILGELVHRVSGRPFAQFVAEQITGALAADFHFALSGPGDTARVAEVWVPPNANPQVESSAMGARAEAEWADIVAREARVRVGRRSVRKRHHERPGDDAESARSCRGAARSTAGDTWAARPSTRPCANRATPRTRSSVRAFASGCSSRSTTTRTTLRPRPRSTGVASEDPG